jgi:hypothetical protein
MLLNLALKQAISDVKIIYGETLELVHEQRSKYLWRVSPETQLSATLAAN